MRRSISIAVACSMLLAVAALFFFVGHGSSFNFDGDWLGNHNRKPGPHDNPVVIYTIGRVELLIKDDTFQMSESGEPVTGTVRFDQDKAFLTPKTFFGRPLDDSNRAGHSMEIELVPQKDGTLLFIDRQGFDAGPIKLIRQSQPKP